jgi:hypothetical protein
MAVNFFLSSSSSLAPLQPLACGIRVSRQERIVGIDCPNKGLEVVETVIICGRALARLDWKPELRVRLR